MAGVERLDGVTTGESFVRKTRLSYLKQCCSTLLPRYAAPVSKEPSDAVVGENGTVLSKLCASFRKSLHYMQSGGLDGLSVFVGDSPSDLAALTAADIGIVLGSKPLLRRVAAAADICLQPLVAGLVLTLPCRQAVVTN